MSMCLLRLPLLLFLAINTTTKLSQYNFNGLEIESTTLRPDMKLFNHTPCDVASKQETNSTSIVEVAVKVCLALLQDTAPPANKNITRCWSLWISATSKVWIGVVNHFHTISPSIHEHAILCPLKISHHFLYSFLVVNTWITLISSQNSNNICNVKSGANLSINKASNSWSIWSILHVFPLKIIFRALT